MKHIKDLLEENYNNLVYDTSYDREIPRELVKHYHIYIVNMFNCSYADFMNNDREETIKYLQENNLEITEIKLERNGLGLNDYRLIVRKKGGR